MINRRSFLAGSLGVSLAAGMASCRLLTSADLTIHLLEHSVPLLVVKGFRLQNGDAANVRFKAEKTLLALFQQLQAWKSSIETAAASEAVPVAASNTPPAQSPADLVTLGDYWLAAAIRQGLIQPVNTERLTHWADLDQAWQTLVRRDSAGLPSETGAVWGVPYRWGSLMLVYNPRRLNAGVAPPQRWADLWRPELARQFILPNHPRVVLGLVLKSLGMSANTTDASALDALTPTLAALNQQTRGYSDNHYLEPLITSDVALSVGWSTDILPMLQQYRHLKAVVPDEGTLLTADLWVRPAGSTEAAADAPVSAAAWMDYCLSADVATQGMLFEQQLSPRLGGNDLQQIESLRQSPLRMFQGIDNPDNEFLYPLPESVESRYASLWEAMRTAATNA